MVKLEIAALAALMLAAAPAAQAAETFHVKTGSTVATWTADNNVCAAKVRKLKPFGPPNLGAAMASGSVLGAAAGGLAVGIMQGIQEAKWRERALDACLREMGYVEIEVTDAEIAGLKAARSRPEKLAWFDGFLKTDLSARIVEAGKPVPALPTVEARSFDVGAARIDPSSLTVASAPVARGGRLLEGRLGLRGAAVLAEDIAFKFGGNFSAAKGAVFFPLDYRTRPDGEVSSAWCGPIAAKGFLAVDSVGCLQSTPAGYSLVGFELGQTADWLAGQPVPDTMMRKPVRGLAVHLQPVEAEAREPVGFWLKYAKPTKSGVLVEAVAQKKDKITFWRGEVPLDAKGEGVLPLWSKRLLLRREGELVRASLSDDGDGRGLLDPLASPAQLAQAGDATAKR